ncbi:MAG: tetratricopeptide repeat protein [Bacteroides sp.]|nr:tetratricopeptide repeat protein [Bacteroides sp.]
MKYILPLLTLISIIYSCHQNECIHPQLSVIETMIDIDVQKASLALSNIKKENIKNEFNKHFYDLLNVGLKFRQSELTLKDDSLLELAVCYFRNINNGVFEAKSLLYRGKIWRKIGDDEFALPLYLRALDLSEETTNYETLTKIYDDLSNIYINQGMYNEAITMLEKAYILDSRNGNNKNMVITLCNIGRAYLFLKQPSVNKKLLNKAYDIACHSENSNELIKYVHYFYSIHYTEINNYEQALMHLSNSINKDDGNDLLSKYLIKGEIYNKQEKYDSATNYLTQSIHSTNIYTKTASYYELYNSFVGLNNVSDALNCLIEYQNGVDSISYMTHESDSQTIAYKYNVEKAVIKAEAKKNVIIFIIISTSLLLLLIVIVVYFTTNKRHKLREKAAEHVILVNQKEVIKKERDIAGLQTKINELQNNFTEYKEILSLIKSKEKELITLLKNSTNYQCAIYKRTSIYKKINELSKQKKGPIY